MHSLNSKRMLVRSSWMVAFWRVPRYSTVSLDFVHSYRTCLQIQHIPRVSTMLHFSSVILFSWVLPGIVSSHLQSKRSVVGTERAQDCVAWGTVSCIVRVLSRVFPVPDGSVTSVRLAYRYSTVLYPPKDLYTLPR